MGTKTLTIELPHELSPAQEHDLKMELAGTLYTKGLLTTSEAAAMVGIGRRAFIEQMGQFGFSTFANYTVENLRQDVANAQRFAKPQLPNFAAPPEAKSAL